MDEKAKTKIIEALVESECLSREEAEVVAQKLEERGEGQSGEPGGNGHGFQEAEPRPMVHQDQAMLNIINWMLETSPQDGLDKMIITSRVAPHMLIDLMLIKTLNEIRKPDFKGDPVELLLSNLMLLSKAMDGKLQNNALLLFEASEAQKREQSMMRQDMYGT